MNRYVRLGYLLPRLVAVIALAVLLQYAAGWAVRRAVVDGGERVVGAKVEIDKSAVALLDTRVTMQGLRVADPRDPMQNLFEADVVELDFETDSLLRRTAVAERGVVRGLRFGGARETSGALEEAGELDLGDAPGWFDGAESGSIDSLFAPWVDDLQDSLASDAAGDLESVQLAERLAADWPQRYGALKASTDELRRQAKGFEQELALARQNPLRHADFLAELPGRVSELRQRLSQLHTEIATMPADAAADRRRVQEAWARDEQLLRQRLQTDQLDPDSLTSTLLGERVTGSVGALIDWVRWARRLVPADSTAEPAPARRGVDVRFVGVRPRPSFLARSLELRGVAKLGSRPTEFSGLVTDLTTQPAAHTEPTRIAIKTEGPTPLEAWATLDRSGADAVDDLRVVCPALALPRQSLPLAKGVALDLAPSSASVTLTMQLKGNRLDGDLRIVQDRLTLTTRSDASATGTTRRIGSALAANLRGVTDLNTTVSLAGTLDRPRVGLRSNLGEVIAQALNGSLETIAREQVERSLAGARHRIDARLGDLDRVVAAATQQLPVELGASADLLRRVSAAAGPANGRLPMGLQQLGDRVNQFRPVIR